jgi:hypothetical protein
MVRLMAPRRTWSSTPSATSSEIRSSVSTRTVPMMPPAVTTSSPTAIEAMSSRCARRRFCWGRTSSRYMPTMSSGKMIRSMVASEG